MLDCDRLYTSLKYSTFNITVMYLVFRFQYIWVGRWGIQYSAIEYPFNNFLLLANLGSMGLVNDLYQKISVKGL